jgi:hypothetical protein
MKKQAKKPAKKAAVKLIEGKYSHKLLCRLEPAIGAKLEELSKTTNNKTLNGTLKHIIVNYSALLGERDELKNKFGVALANGAHYKRLVDTFTGAFKALQDIKPITKVQTSIWERDEEEEEEEDN